MLPNEKKKCDLERVNSNNSINKKLAQFYLLLI